MHPLRMALCVSVLSTAAYAQFNPTFHVDCSHGESLQTAVTFALPGSTIVVKGNCIGPVLIITPGLTLDGRGTAAILGAGRDAVTINGAPRVTLSGLSVRSGNNGVVAQNGSGVTLRSVSVSGNAFSGILVRANSAATLNGGSSSGNGLYGVDAESTSSLNIVGAFASTGNAVFGLQVNNGSSLNLAAGNLTATGNVVGVQVGTNSAGFLDGASSINASNNFAIGLTMVSGAHMVDFGGAITASGNGLQGIALDSKSGLDLDAGAQVQANGNGGDGVHLEALSVMTIFNTPQFSGSSSTTTLRAQGNQANGVNLLANSAIFDTNYAALQVSGNSGAGIALDDGSAINFAQTVPVSGVQTNVTGNHPDLRITFASRATTLSNDTVGTANCDATSLVRGTLAITCPH
ncbi:MAG TPA: right-handed parallel beta-helix repeat-containing protein [Terracidiphilus sp.]